jgi:hypothetical protein
MLRRVYTSGVSSESYVVIRLAQTLICVALQCVFERMNAKSMTRKLQKS